MNKIDYVVSTYAACTKVISQIMQTQTYKYFAILIVNSVITIAWWHNKKLYKGLFNNKMC